MVLCLKLKVLSFYCGDTQGKLKLKIPCVCNFSFPCVWSSKCCHFIAEIHRENWNYKHREFSFLRWVEPCCVCCRSGLLCRNVLKLCTVIKITCFEKPYWFGAKLWENMATMVNFVECIDKCCAKYQKACSECLKNPFICVQCLDVMVTVFKSELCCQRYTLCQPCVAMRTLCGSVCQAWFVLSTCRRGEGSL